MNEPVIFIGMHRSGTSLLVRLLRDLGLFVGVKRDSNDESLLFQGLNVWMLAQAGGRWDHPAAIDDILGDQATLELVEQYLRQVLSGPRALQYLGWRRYAQHRGLLQGLDVPWGWKDPRNTYTLPVWLRLYPRAKVVYIERHGVDVARSLVTRRNKHMRVAIGRYEKWRKLYYIRKKASGFSHSVRCASLEGALSLWREYVERGRAHVEALGSERALSLKYETLLEAPEKSLSQAARFAGLQVSDQRLADVVGQIRPSRCYAYREDACLQEFAMRKAGSLLGYEA